MTLAELLADVIRRLERSGIPYMVTGSIASTFHGEPRATRDLDIVIDPEPDSLTALVDDLAADGYYVDRDAAFAALRERTQFNAVGPAATKVDLIIRKDRPFSREEFGRRRQVDLLGTSAFIASVEDLCRAVGAGAGADGGLAAHSDAALGGGVGFDRERATSRRPRPYSTAHLRPRC